MNLKTKALLIAIFGCGLLLPSTLKAEGGGREKRGAPSHRMQNQKDRIRQGVKSGELTKQEAEQLRQEHRGIRKEREQLKSDGELTPEERGQLQEKINAASEHIHQEKHDEEKRPLRKKEPVTSPGAVTEPAALSPVPAASQ